MMTSIFDQSWLNVVFDGRNQSYGAFKIRRTAGRSAALALLVTFGLAGVGLLLPNLLKSVVAVVTPIIDTDPIPYWINPDPTQTVPSVPPPRTTPSNAIVIVHKVAEIDSTDVLDTLDLTPGPTPGPTGSIGGTTGTIGKHGNTGTGTTTTIEKKTPGPHTWVEVMPQYPGGEAALIRDVQSLVKFTPEMLKWGMEGTVYVRFVVNEEGYVTEPFIERGFGFGSEDMVKNAVVKLKQWRPGRQGGVAVPVYFAMPVEFHLQ